MKHVQSTVYIKIVAMERYKTIYTAENIDRKARKSNLCRNIITFAASPWYNLSLLKNWSWNALITYCAHLIQPHDLPYYALFLLLMCLESLKHLDLQVMNKCTELITFKWNTIKINHFHTKILISLQSKLDLSIFAPCLKNYWKLIIVEDHQNDKTDLFSKVFDV